MVAARAAPVSTLPNPRTPLIGRSGEVATACALLTSENVPLLTLTGPGGVGKTRLALAIAHEIEDAFADGVLFVDLSPIRDPDIVLATIAQVVNVRERSSGSLAAALTAFFKPRQILLIVDNCEQVLDAAPAIAGLLSACPAVQVIATSRAPLRIRMEQILPVEPLAVPASNREMELSTLASTEAVALFMERARALDPGFALGMQNAAAIAEICRRLDGLPLAIEFAAARLRTHSPHDVITLLDRRLQALTDGPRDLPARHRTLHEAIAWSYDLLDPPTRAIFARLAFFAGGLTLAAADAVAGGNENALPVHPHPPLPASLETLVEQSLLRRDVRPDGTVRFGFLETIREFAHERLVESGELDEVSRRHAHWFLAFARRGRSGFNGAEPNGWLERLSLETDNVRAALGWTLEQGDTELGLRLTRALEWYWMHGGHLNEGRQWQERLLAASGGLSPLVRARGHLTAGILSFCAGDERAAELSLEECLALSRDLGKDELAADALSWLANMELALGSLNRGVELCEEALALYGRAGNDRDTHFPLAGLGVAARFRGEFAQARSYYEQSLSAHRRRQSANGIAMSIIGFGEVAAAAGDFEEAAARFKESLRLHAEYGGSVGIGYCLLGLGMLAAKREQTDDAIRLFAALEVLWETAGFLLEDEQRVAKEVLVALGQTELGREGFAAAWAAGRAAPLEQVIAETLNGTDRAPVMPPTHARSAVNSGTVALSKREQEVLALLAQRLSDFEIAEALFISRRTASNHVTSLFNKLGVSNRRDAAAVAARSRII